MAPNLKLRPVIASDPYTWLSSISFRNLLYSHQTGINSSGVQIELFTNPPELSSSTNRKRASEWDTAASENVFDSFLDPLIILLRSIRWRRENWCTKRAGTSTRAKSRCGIRSDVMGDELKGWSVLHLTVSLSTCPKSIISELAWPGSDLSEDNKKTDTSRGFGRLRREAAGNEGHLSEIKRSFSSFLFFPLNKVPILCALQ